MSISKKLVAEEMMKGTINGSDAFNDIVSKSKERINITVITHQALADKSEELSIQARILRDALSHLLGASMHIASNPSINKARRLAEEAWAKTK